MRGPSVLAGGTGLFVAPEYQLRGARGAPGDTWALGITMLFALQIIKHPEARFVFDLRIARGRDPEATHAMRSWTEHIMRQRDEILPLCESWLQGTVQHALHTDPTFRPTASTLLWNALRRESGAASTVSTSGSNRFGVVPPRPYHGVPYTLNSDARALTPSLPAGPSQLPSSQRREWKDLVAKHKMPPKTAPTQMTLDQAVRRAPRRNEGRNDLNQHPYHADCGCHALRLL